MKRRKNPFPGVCVFTDRHGRRRFRLRRTIKGRKVDIQLPGPYGGAEFRTAYESALEGVQGPKGRAAPGTFSFLITAYLSSPAYLDLSVITKSQKRRRLDWFRQIIGSARYDQMKARHVEALMLKKAGVTAANRVRKDLAQLFTFAAKRFDYKGTNPAQLADSRKVKSDGHHTWTPEEIAQFREHHPTGTRPRLAFEIFYGTGAARQDASRLTWANVRDGRFRYERGKTGQRVDLDLNEVPDLRAELEHVPTDQVMLLLQDKGAAYSPDRLGKVFKDWCLSAGLPEHCTAHGLRKAGAKRLAEADANSLQIMAFLGHATPTMAARYVAAASRAKMADAGLAKLTNLSHGLVKKGS